MRALPLILALLLVGCDALGGGGGVEIVRYTGDPITRADARGTDPVLGTPVAWRGERVGDVVAVTRSVLCGDECGETLTLRFEGSGDLPSDAAGMVVVREFLPERTELTVLDIERVEIQDWGPDVVSGVVVLAREDGRLDLQAPIVFWADNLDPAE